MTVEKEKFIKMEKDAISLGKISDEKKAEHKFGKKANQRTLYVGAKI
jgi:hypothetical protein